MVERLVGRARGVIQGVGFRPFVARLAEELSLDGHIRNAADHVEIEIEGTPPALDQFKGRILLELPRAAHIDGIDWCHLAPTGETGFRIIGSATGTPSLGIPPDLAVCDMCLAEVFDPTTRRHQYAFTNCTCCGPRFTITEHSPYDRERTSMAPFPMCSSCKMEYEDPCDRRFHAQPIACPQCGPSLRMVAPDGATLAAGGEALAMTVTALRKGEIVAIKGLGGFQLLVRADDNRAVERLRVRKRRPTKPLALLVPDLDAARVLAHVSDDEARALRHPAAPIVLLAARGGGVAPAVAPNQHRLGLMLPATPLHALIARHVDAPVVCTSGNLHDEPICTDNADALARLNHVADAFLVHDRAILRRADDSVVHVVGGRMRALRVARGLAPIALSMERAVSPVLALGGHLKHAPALAVHRRVIVWPQLGDLSSPTARDAMVRSIQDLEAFLGVRAPAVATDSHPDYATTIWARASGREVVHVQHHHAHVASVLAEHGEEAALGFAWDGVGAGADGSLWGGETLAVSGKGARRVGHLRPFPLPGGDAAARDGRRVLAGLCVAAGVRPPNDDPAVLRFMSVAASPRLAQTTTSVGRLFDGVAALTGVATTSSFEGEAAMHLEAIAESGATSYPFTVADAVIDWRPMFLAMLSERHDPVRVASRFHATLACVVCEVARQQGARLVALAGGCFQNELLLRLTLSALGAAGIRALASERVPPGDGGLALGQAWVASSAGQSCV